GPGTGFGIDWRAVPITVTQHLPWRRPKTTSGTTSLLRPRSLSVWGAKDIDANATNPLPDTWTWSRTTAAALSSCHQALAWAKRRSPTGSIEATRPQPT